MTLAQVKKRAIRKELLAAEGNIAVAARELGVSRQSVYTYAKTYRWLDDGGRIDPNLVADARRCREYWQPAELRDIPSKREEKRKRMGQVNCERIYVDMGAVKCGDSDRISGY